MDSKRKFWNEQQQVLRQALARPADHQQAVELFLAQHAMVHAGAMSGAAQPTLEDEVWQDLSDIAARCIPPKMEHSIAWLFYHLTRCEDITMNILLSGGPQVIHTGNWVERMRIPICDTGNAMDANAIAAFSAAVDIPVLWAYRAEVGRQTRLNVQALPPGSFKQPVDPTRLPRIIEEGAVVEGAYGLIEYWGGLTLGGLLLMPPTRHNLVHINEALKIKQKCR
jgi:hypothetical protein